MGKAFISNVKISAVFAIWKASMNLVSIRTSNCRWSSSHFHNYLVRSTVVKMVNWQCLQTMLDNMQSASLSISHTHTQQNHGKYPWSLVSGFFCSSVLILLLNPLFSPNSLFPPTVESKYSWFLVFVFLYLCLYLPLQWFVYLNLLCHLYCLHFASITYCLSLCQP